MKRTFISAFLLLACSIGVHATDLPGVTVEHAATGTPAYVQALSAIGRIEFTDGQASIVFKDASSGTENGHTWVDLGLSSGTKWATCNVGAETPESAGSYFAWGEIEQQSSNTYDWSSYKWCNGTFISMTKYCTDSEYGTVDNKTELDDADDVAVHTWGGKWKMPTKAQQEELLTECYWVWTTSYNGKSANGYIVYKAKSASDKGKQTNDDSSYTPSYSYSVSTDAHIFLPATGLRHNGGLYDAGFDGCYWSRSLDADNASDACLLYFHANNVIVDYDERLYGLSVRPVCPATE